MIQQFHTSEKLKIWSVKILIAALLTIAKNEREGGFIYQQENVWHPKIQLKKIFQEVVNNYTKF